MWLYRYAIDRPGLCIFGGALIVRLIWILYLPKDSLFPPIFDQITYCELSENILTKRMLCVSRPLFSAEPETPSSIWPPLYPLFLSLCFWLFGKEYLLVRLFQAVMGAGSCLILYLIGKRIFGKGVGTLAGVICSLYPYLIFYSGLLMVETLYILFLLSMFFFLLQDAKKSPILLGIFFALSSLTKPAIFGYILFIVPYLIAKRGSKGALLFFLAASILFSPWIIRNWLVHRQFILLTTFSGYNLYKGNNERATGGEMALPEIDWPNYSEYSEAERDRIFRQKALSFIWQNPRRFAELILAKAIEYWRPYAPDPDTANYDIPNRLYKAIAYLSYLPIFVFFLIGAGVVMLLRVKPAYPILFLILYYTSVHLIFLSALRYRLPMAPFIILLAAFGLSRVVVKLKMVHKVDGSLFKR